MSNQWTNQMQWMLGSILSIGFLLALTGCDRDTQEKAKERQAEAQQKLRKLGNEAKQRARELDHNIQQAVQPDGKAAAAKVDDAALLAKVKAKLASDVGLATLEGVNVDIHGSVVTLRGTVASESQRQAAQRAASQVSGVTSVNNELKILP